MRAWVAELEWERARAWAVELEWERVWVAESGKWSVVGHTAPK